MLESLSIKGNATCHAALRLVRKLSKNNEVYAVAPLHGGGGIDESKIKLFKDVNIFYDEFAALYKFQEKCNWMQLPVFKRVLLGLAHPSLSALILYRKYLEYTYSVNKYYQKAIEEACEKWQIDAVIGFCMPYVISITLANSNIKALKTIVQFDPFTNNYNLRSRTIASSCETRKKIEIDFINKLDCSFVADFVYDEMSRLGLGNANKLVSMPFPAIETDADGNFNNLEDFNNKLNCDNKNKIIKFLYTGVFYDIIRNPEFLLKLFEKLPENYEFHFVGGGAWNTVKKFINKLGKRLVIYGWRSSDEVKNFLREADILVCLNNSITNQMSSKLLEYICTGKPILNIYKVDDCPSLKYTAKYKNCMDLKEAEITPDMLSSVINFVDTHINTLEPLDDIMKNFKENTDFHAANMIEDKLNELLKNRSK